MVISITSYRNTAPKGLNLYNCPCKGQLLLQGTAASPVYATSQS
jgi:hypothetical protein